MSFSNKKQRASRSPKVEYVTSWPAVMAFVTLTVVLISGSVAGLAWKPHNRFANKSQVRSSHISQLKKEVTANFKATRNDTTVSVEASHTVPSQPLPSIVEEQPLPKPASDSAPHIAAVTTTPVIESQTTDPPTMEETEPTDMSTETGLNTEPFSIPRFDIELLNDLKQHSKELDFEAVERSAAQILRAAAEAVPSESTFSTEGIFPGEKFRRRLLAQRSDLVGLPFRTGDQCRKHPEEVRFMASTSASVGRVLMIASRASHQSWSYSNAVDAAESIRNSDKLQRPEAVSTLVQMLQVEPLPVRFELIRVLSGIQHPLAGVALAERAIFDVAEEVRVTAIEALKSQSVEKYRHRLFDGLRYPWAPASYFAAQALISLDDKESVSSLVEMLDEADPNLSFINDDGVYVKRELVRINHLRNCVLCHAPSQSRSDLVRGSVPTPGRPIPAGYNSRSRGEFVQADVVYLKQDFSVMHHVENADPWPTRQRFDYVVRVRELTPEEQEEATVNDQTDTHRNRTNPTSFPQRQAILLALRELTGKDAGESSENWRAFLANGNVRD